MNKQEAQLIIDVFNSLGMNDIAKLKAQVLILRSLLSERGDESLINLVENAYQGNLSKFVEGYEVYQLGYAPEITSPNFCESAEGYTFKKPNMRVDPIKAIEGGGWGKEFLFKNGETWHKGQLRGLSMRGYVQYNYTFAEDENGNSAIAETATKEMKFCDDAEIIQDWLLDESEV